MKTDDDTFVRMDEVVAAVTTSEVSQGLLYGSIQDIARSAHDQSTPWYSTEQVRVCIIKCEPP